MGQKVKIQADFSFLVGGGVVTMGRMGAVGEDGRVTSWGERGTRREGVRGEGGE